jgi:hypothetical protein
VPHSSPFNTLPRENPVTWFVQWGFFACRISGRPSKQRHQWDGAMHAVDWGSMAVTAPVLDYGRHSDAHTHPWCSAVPCLHGESNAQFFNHSLTGQLGLQASLMDEVQLRARSSAKWRRVLGVQPRGFGGFTNHEPRGRICCRANSWLPTHWFVSCLAVILLIHHDWVAPSIREPCCGATSD